MFSMCLLLAVLRKNYSTDFSQIKIHNYTEFQNSVETWQMSHGRTLCTSVVKGKNGLSAPTAGYRQYSIGAHGHVTMSASRSDICSELSSALYIRPTSVNGSCSRLSCWFAARPMTSDARRRFWRHLLLIAFFQTDERLCMWSLLYRNSKVG